MKTKKFILILILLIFIIKNFFFHNKIENFYSKNTLLIWRADYKNNFNVETDIEKFIKNDKKILHISNFKLENYLEKINKKFKIISDFDDFCVPSDKRNNNLLIDKFEKICNNNNLIEWYAVNYNSNIKKYDKIKYLPLGLDYHTIAEKNHWGEKKTTPYNQEKILINIYNNSLRNNQRKNKCFMCSSINNSYSLKKAGYVNYDRDDINKKLKNNKNVDICNGFLPRTQLWKTFVKYKFVIAPAGNGMDTHRLWEALFLGCIVIVQETGLDNLMREFPVVIVKDFNEINEKNLELWGNIYSNMCHDKQIRQKYYTKYWFNKISTF